MVGRIGKKERELTERIAELEAQLKEVNESKDAAADDSNVVVQQLEGRLADMSFDRDICAEKYNALLPHSQVLIGQEQTELLGVMSMIALMHPRGATEMGEGSLFERASPFALQALGNYAAKALESWLDAFEEADAEYDDAMEGIEASQRQHAVKLAIDRIFRNAEGKDTSED